MCCLFYSARAGSGRTPLEEEEGETLMGGAFVMSPEGSEGEHTRQQSSYVLFAVCYTYSYLSV
jgi:hypothetical protein